MNFLNRKEEWRQLDDLYKRDRGILAIAYGRRGIGKTTLVQRWITTRHHRAIYWSAPLTSPRLQLQSFSQAIRAFETSDTLIPTAYTCASWDNAFEEILRLADKERLVVVLDDFDHLIIAKSEFPRTLQRIWDHRLQTSNVMLFLIGSNVRAMEYDVLSYRAPMYGRAWWIDFVRPRSFADLKILLPNYSMVDRITLYACIGGVPRYLQLVDPQSTPKQNLVRVVSSLVMLEDVDILLREQFDQPHLCAAILDSLIRWITDSKMIAQALGVEHREVSKCLKVLERAKILRWAGPATARFPDTSRLGHYHVADQYLHFYFRCLAPIRSLLERGETKSAIAHLRVSLDEFIGAEIFPNLCREWLYRQGETLPFHPMYVGSYWGEGTEPIDIVAINHDEHGILFGKCNWSKHPTDEQEVLKLIEQAAAVVPQPAEEWHVSFGFFSRSGFTKAAQRAVGKARCVWVNLNDLDTGLNVVARRKARRKLRF
ncbi:MAG: AAA family ATPase [Chloroflexi bacterium]|nr:AAA family ATPase [Chloroflexota bacterium]